MSQQQQRLLIRSQRSPQALPSHGDSQAVVLLQLSRLLPQAQLLCLEALQLPRGWSHSRCIGLIGPVLTPP